MRSIPRKGTRRTCKVARRKTRKQRRALQASVGRVPARARPLLDEFAGAFTRPTFPRFVVLLLAAVVTTGCRTVLNVLRTVGGLAAGHPSSYHRVFSRRRWASWHLARGLAGYILRHWVPEGVVNLAGDDTVDQHTGDQVYGKACHRDAVRSTHSYTAYRWGHKWVVLAILVWFPFASRPWALPVLVVLYRSKEVNKKEGRRHKTPSELMRQMLAVLLRWFPDRQFLFAGDGGFGTHELARFAHRHRRRLAMVSKFYPDANLYAPPPKTTAKRRGRPRTKGAKQRSPEEVVKKADRQKLTVRWYGGGRRRVAVVTGTSHWFKAGHGLVPVRWVFVHDLTGTHRDDYFFSTELELSPREIIERFTGRWSIETTFQEMRAYLKLEKTRGRTKNTVMRVAPCLFGLFSVIALWFAELPARERKTAILWPGKTEMTFSDAITAVRRWLWTDWIFATPHDRLGFAKLSGPFREILLANLAPAA